MNLIPVFKKANITELSKKFGLKFPLSEWVEAQIGEESYESNRYDVEYHDPDENRYISVYLYMNEDSNEVLAIDDIVKNVNENVRYQLTETPFNEVLQSLLAQKTIEANK